MQAVRNHIQVVARYDRSPPALAPDYPDSTSYNGNGDLMSHPSGLYRRVMILITNMQRKAYSNMPSVFKNC